MKKSDTLLREYVKKISDEDLKFLNSRLQQKMSGDRAEVSNLLSQDKDVDKWLSSASSGDEFFDMLESVEDFVDKEVKRRSSARIEKTMVRR